MPSIVPVFIALALQAGHPQAAPARLEVALAALSVPDAELVHWDVVLDGAVVARKSVDGLDPSPAEWNGTVAPGPHTVGLRVAYRRPMKTIARDEAGGVAFTFVVPGERTVEQQGTIDARPAEVVRVAAVIDDAPAQVDDQIVLARTSGNEGPRRDGTVVEIGGRSSFQVDAPKDACTGRDADRCLLLTFARIFGSTPRD